MAGQSRPRPAPGAAGPRRLGAPGARPASAGAQRRLERSRRRHRAPLLGWIAVAAVVIAVVALVVARLTGSSGPPPNTAADRNPPLAPVALVRSVTSVPASTFDAVGTSGEGSPFLVTRGQPALRSGGKPRLVYVGGEFCPYCAMYRWSLLAALGRFGSFSGVKLTRSAATDYNIPTFSFYKSSYSSPYVAFTPYEASDRNRNRLTPLPPEVSRLYAKYEAPPYGSVANEGSIPFIDIGNRFVSEGVAPAFDAQVLPALAGGGPARSEIAAAIRSPNSATGRALGGAVFVAQANYLSAAICILDGGKPASVCRSSGVTAARKVLLATKPTG
ncbi:MAG TPA: DUF929 family protein [Acidimicrobiales bacterium]|nr:DUF929 family protein [Acidimicrobiales bacterium]